MYCSNCGSEIGENQSYCNECGNIIKTFVISLDECRDFCENIAHCQYRKAYWSQITVKNAVKSQITESCSNVAVLRKFFIVNFKITKAAN